MTRHVPALVLELGFRVWRQNEMMVWLMPAHDDDDGHHLSLFV
jgi:hypothetical protein